MKRRHKPVLERSTPGTPDYLERQDWLASGQVDQYPFGRVMMKVNKLAMIIAVATLGMPALASAQSVQPADANSMAAGSNQGPKTREQVREELAHARMNGTIPRFGNPDPYGPGGTPNFTRH
ncbi:DUF4148 domain-containing protein [Paraburkholderia phenazinium]|jgi:hypothetical protein|nr:DUF4148 domain-containing protein [Paraburkholderia phenazinium]